MSYMRETCHVSEGLDLTKWKKNLGVTLKSFGFFFKFLSTHEKYLLKSTCIY